MLGFSWQEIGIIVAVVTSLGGTLLVVLRDRLAGDFARKADVDAMSARVGALEARIGTMPNHEDVRSLTDRVGKVEQAVAVVSAEMRGATAMLAKVDRGVTMLLDHHLRESSKV